VIGADALVETALAVADRARLDAEAVVEYATAIVTYARTGEGPAPSPSALAAVARATGATAHGRDGASRLLRAVRVRARLAAGQRVGYADAAAAAGLSRQYVHRAYGAFLPASVVAEMLRGRQ
jgi:hypothetical protein